MNTPKLDMVGIAREVLGVPQRTAIMEDLDVIDKRLDALIADNRNLRAENLALAERLRQAPELRSIVGELRGVYADLDLQNPRQLGRERLARLLRRLDRESEGQ